MASLSGGEKVKLQLACMLTEKPNLLLLDEPSNDIDINTLKWLEKFIINSKIPVLYISHDYNANEMKHKIKALSVGQKAKLPFLKMILEKYNMLIPDEPTRDFSPPSTPLIRQLLKDFKGTIISISHDGKYIKEVYNNIYELNEKGLKRIELL